MGGESWRGHSDMPTDSVEVEGTVADTKYRAAPRAGYGSGTRCVVSILAGTLAGLLLVNSMEVGTSLAFGEDITREWTMLLWGSHWVWRAVWSLAATSMAGFLVGMIVRDRGSRAGVLAAAPSAMYWAFLAYSGWAGQMPFSASAIELPMGYRIVATILAIATIPLSALAAEEGAPYGRANGEHFDRRRWTLLGVRWYHFLWLPFLIHALVLQATWGAMYSFGWLTAAWRAGHSVGSFVPAIFVVAMLASMQLIFTGAFRAYEALAGFEEENPLPVWRRLLTYGFGYPLSAAAAQAVITAVHFGLARFVGYSAGTG